MKVLYFSPTGNTKKICEFLSRKMQVGLRQAQDRYLIEETIDFTIGKVRSSAEHIQMVSSTFCKEDVVIIGVPVYAGRVPNVLLKYFSQYRGNGARLIVVLSYGNRHYDDAAKEAYQIFSNRGFDVMAVVCTMGEHSFSRILAKNRPDRADLAVLSVVSDQLVRLLDDALFEAKEVELIAGHQLILHSIRCLEDQLPLKPYFTPVDKEGHPFDFKKIKPVTLETCTSCGICASMCPMDSISNTDFDKVEGPCIKCCACVKRCPAHAKVFNDENFIKHRMELEEAFIEKERAIELFI
ncbi:4Fe-4S binding protein [Fusibacter bizertensis]